MAPDPASTPPTEPAGDRGPAPAEVRALPVLGLGEVRPGDDLGALLAPLLERAGARDGDVLCVAGKVFSKAMGLIIDPAQKQQAVREQAVRTVARRRHGSVTTEVVQLAHGPVMAAAGIDASNSPDGLLLLPPDPDACAAGLRSRLQELTGLRLAVVVTDTSSRVWRQGVGDIALGASGLRSLQDLRGTADAAGRALGITVRNLADELAGTADLVKGKATGVPAALVRGLDDAVVDDPALEIPAAALSRTDASDWFRRPSLESAWQALGIVLDEEPVAAMDPEPVPIRIRRAIRVARQGADPDLVDVRAEETRTLVAPVQAGPLAWAAAGALAERIRTALRAEAIADEHPDLLGHRVELALEEETR